MPPADTNLSLRVGHAPSSTVRWLEVATPAGTTALELYANGTRLHQLA